MKKIITAISSPTAISIYGLLSLCLLIWFVGPLIKFGADNYAPLADTVPRLIGVIIIVVFWGGNNLRVQHKDKKDNNDLIDALSTNNELNEQKALDEQSTHEVQQINERFTDALTALKNVKFTNGHKGKTIYQLPWYMIIGPPGSGKTTALVNSTLNFPLASKIGEAALDGIGGTRNCDWWFTDQAVLIDTAGRYTTQDSHRILDSSGWEGFLNLLKKHRKRRPINGVIVAISLEDILHQPEEEIKNHADTLRNRINELMDKLEVRFPIYLMFTKSDLVSGFSEFFEDLGAKEREQVWGITLPETSLTSDKIFSFIEQQFNDLIRRLYERVLWRVHQERDINRRGRIQGFPQQMEMIKPTLQSFIEYAFSSNKFQNTPYLRGIYFTSGTQDGTPIDRMMTSVVNTFGFSREVAKQNFSSQGKSYFIGNLFRQVIFPEYDLVGSNQRYEKIVSWTRRACFVGLAAVSISVMLIWLGSVTQHKQFISDVQNYVDVFNQHPKPLIKTNLDLREELPRLNALRNASNLYNEESHRWLSNLGLYDQRLDNAADKTYQDYLKIQFLPELANYIGSYLKKGYGGGDLYNNFRVYLMLNKTERLNDTLILDWFEQNLSERLEGQAAQREELISHIENLMTLKFDPVNLEDKLINSVRNELKKIPVAQRIYSKIRSQPEYNQPIDMINVIGESLREVYKSSENDNLNLSIPWMFTIEGYNNLDLSKNSQLITDILNDSWILAGDKGASFDFDEKDFEEVSEKVKDLYLADYINIWNSVFDKLAIVDFKDLAHASEILSKITDPVYSPVLAFLQTSKANTELTPLLNQSIPGNQLAGKIPGKVDTSQVIGGLSSNLKEKMGNIVDKQFNAVNQLSRNSKNGVAPIDAMIQSIVKIQSFIDNILIAPNPSKEAFEASKSRYQNNAVNTITSLESYANKMPKPIQGWLKSIADQSWKVVLNAGKNHLNKEWNIQVYRPYSRVLKNGYPINRKAKDEIAILDFSDFFKEKGTLDTFSKSFLSPFINSRIWKNRSVSGRTMGISNSVLTQLKKAQLIQDVFFRQNPNSPQISFQMKPEQMNKKDARFVLELGDERMSYNHGPRFWKKINWSGDSENNRVRLVFEDLNGEFHSKIYDTPWAWFRLLDDAQISNTSAAKTFKTTFSIKENINSESGRSLSNIHDITYLIKADSVKNPFSKDLLGSFRFPEVI